MTPAAVCMHEFSFLLCSICSVELIIDPAWGSPQSLLQWSVEKKRKQLCCHSESWKFWQFILFYLVCATFLKTRHLRPGYMNMHLSCKFSHILPVYGSAGDAFLLRVLHELCIFTDSVLLVNQRVKGLHVWIQYTHWLAVSVDRQEACLSSLRYASSMTRKRVAYILHSY